jgi:hypothetical protein
MFAAPMSSAQAICSASLTEADRAGYTIGAVYSNWRARTICPAIMSEGLDIRAEPGGAVADMISARRPTHPRDDLLERELDDGGCGGRRPGRRGGLYEYDLHHPTRRGEAGRLRTPLPRDCAIHRLHSRHRDRAPLPAIESPS